MGVSLARIHQLLRILSGVLIVFMVCTLYMGCGNEGGESAGEEGDINAPGANDDDDEEFADSLLGGVIITEVPHTLLPGAMIELLNNDTGEPFDPPLVRISNIRGYFEFDDIPHGHHYVAYKTSHNGRKDTYQHYIVTGAKNDYFLSYSVREYLGYHEIMPFELDSEKGFLKGEIFYDPVSGKNSPVGCVDVQITPKPEDFYYTIEDGSDFVFTQDRMPDEPGNPQNGEGTHPSSGHFVVFNLLPGTYNITIYINDTERQFTLPNVRPDALTYFCLKLNDKDFPSHPTKDWCTH